MDRLWRSLTQAWWAPIAVLLAFVEVVIGIVIIANEQNPGSLVGGTLFILGGVVIVIGLVMRLERVDLGSALVLVGAFWGLPIIWLVAPAVLTIVVWIGVLTSWPRATRPTTH